MSDFPKVEGMVKIWGWRCNRCYHEWLPRDRSKVPKVCASCRSPYWNQERQRGVGKKAQEDKKKAFKP